jgi:hypothetical protein
MFMTQSHTLKTIIGLFCLVMHLGGGCIMGNMSAAHMRAPPPLGQAEDDDFHPDGWRGPPSAGCGRRSGPSAPARKGQVRLHQPHPNLEIQGFIRTDRFTIKKI